MKDVLRRCDMESIPMEAEVHGPVPSGLWVVAGEEEADRALEASLNEILGRSGPLFEELR